MIIIAPVNEERVFGGNTALAPNILHILDAEVEDSPKTAPMDIEKLQSTLKQFVRDWSEVGKEERDMSYAPILQELDRLYPKIGDNNDSGLDTTGKSAPARSKVKVLVPGAGLGRLAFDIANNGFECQGNEFSLYMLIGSNYVLNK